MAAQHNTNEKSELTAISAPYNFVPLARWVYLPDWGRQVSHDRPFRDGYSGEIAYRLVAESPLLVGGKRKKATDNTPGEVHPFEIDGRYALPGSSLKGMLRAVVETAGFGRMRMIDDQRFGVRDLTNLAREFYGKLMSTSSGQKTFQPKVKAGWLYFDHNNKQWIIRPCEFARVEHDDLATYSNDSWWKNVPRVPAAKGKYIKWGEMLEIHFDPGPDEPHTHSQGKKLIYRKAQNLGKGKSRGTLVFTGQPSKRDRKATGKKHLEFIFFNERSDTLEIKESVWNDFAHIYADNDDWAFWKERHRNNKQPIPVFYLPSNSGKVKSLGLSMMYRLAYLFSTFDLLKHSNIKHAETPGDSTGTGYDLADLMFGAVGDEPADALRGRVSCETAIAEGNPQPQQQPDTILNSPKPTYYPNYITQNTDGDNYEKLAGKQYATYTETRADGKPTLRGFKRYPARPAGMTGVQHLKDGQRNPGVEVKLHTLNSGTTFSGRIVFHNLRSVELGALLWTLTWGGNPQRRHSLGMGKSFGFGQVRFKIDHTKSQLIPNDPVQPAENLTPEGTVNLIKKFTTHMESVCQAHKHKWQNSPQITNLLAMTSPNAANNLPKGMQLRHMRLDNPNEFVKAKKVGLALADYATATRWSDSSAEHPAHRITKQPNHDWLKQYIQSITTKTPAPNLEEILGGQPLANAWAAIEDAKLKSAVLSEIRKYWQQAGWWDNPPTKAKRKAKAIYREHKPK